MKRVSDVDCDTRIGARSFFDRWYRDTLLSKLPPLQKIATLFLDHLTGLLGYTIHRVTNATTEGFNSKIK